jgi:hypothetical protein
MSRRPSVPQMEAVQGDAASMEACRTPSAPAGLATVRLSCWSTLLVDAAVGEGAGGGDRGEGAEDEVGEGDRVDGEVEQRAACEVGVGQPVGAVG